jgi:Holliday junction resolvase
VSSPGDRGKAAEKTVLGVLTKWNLKYVRFAFERLADARAARGAIKAQLCDFIVHVPDHFVMLEVKETTHEFRIAKDKLAQLPNMKKWIEAGATGLALIHHSTLLQWRVVDLALIATGEPSWDLREFPLWPSAEAALVSTQLFN